MTAVRIIRPGLLTVVQDLGRWGYEHWGVMVGGALDEYALRWANALVGNGDGMPALEVTAFGPELEVVEEGILGLAGADLGLAVNGGRWEPGESRWVEAGDRLRFGVRRWGFRAYLSFPGGISASRVLGSAATDLVAGVGGMQGRALRAGDVIQSANMSGAIARAPATTVRVSHAIRVMPGVRADRFPDGSWAQLLTRSFRVSADSNAIGLRLEGEAVAAPHGDWPSEGMAIGSIECPPSGHLLVLLKNRGSLGGYPALAHVIRADWPVLAQLAPGDMLGFYEVSLAEARAALAVLEAQFTATAGAIAPRSLVAPVTGLVRGMDGYGRLLPRPGEWVWQGQVVRRVESMGWTTDVTAPFDGVLGEARAEGDLVEEGEVLCRIEGVGENDAIY